MGHSIHPRLIRLVVPVLATMPTIALAITPLVTGKNAGDRCEGYNGVGGICEPIYQCPALEQEAHEVPLPEYIARHGPNCDYDPRGDKLLCCPTEQDAEISRLEHLLEDLRNSISAEVATLSGKMQNQQSVIQGLQSISNTLSDEVATLTGKIQDQQSMIQGLQSICNTLPDEIDGLHQRINDHHNQTKMQYDELNNKIGKVCVDPFEGFKGACYHFNYTSVTWFEARKDCLTNGGDLAVDNFNIIREFYNLKQQGETVAWIGVRRNVWLNGQEVQQQQWWSGEPDAEDQCGWMGSEGLGDYTCNTPRHFICQLY